MATNAEIVTQLYVGFYDRAPDPEGLQYWIGRLEAGVSQADIANSFATSPEAIATYPFFSFPELVSAETFLKQVYLNLLGRAIDEGAGSGLEYYSAKLTAGVAPGVVLDEIIRNATTNETAGNTDKAFLANKVAVGIDWATTAANKPGFTFDAAAKTSAQTILDSVNETDASVTAAKAATVTFFDKIGAVDFTTGVDAIAGDSSNNVFNATQLTFQAGDTLSGGAGTDKLNYVDTSAASSTIAAATVSGVEVINVSAKGGAASGTAVAETATVQFGALVAGQSYTVAGRTVTALSSASAEDVAGAFATGTSTSLLAVSGSLIGYSSTNPSTTTGQAVFTSNLAGNVSDLVATAETHTVTGVTIADVTPDTTDSTVIAVAGRTLTIGNQAAAGTTLISAATIVSYLTGASTPASGSGITVTGSFSSWTVAESSTSPTTLLLTSIATGVVAAPTATSTVGATASNLSQTTVNGAASAPGVASVSIVQGVAGTSATVAEVTVTAGNFSGATEFNSVDSSQKVIVSGVSATQAVGLSGGSSNLEYTVASGVTATTVSLKGVSGTRTVENKSTGITTATVNSTGSANTATLNLSADASITTLAVNAATNLTATLLNDDYVTTGAALTVSGAAAKVDLGTAGVFKTIDASGLTAGGLTITTSAVTSSVKGGAGADVITLGGLTATGTIDLGAGNDILRGTVALAAGVTIDGGAGTDTVSSTLINAVNGARFVNFEVLELGANTLDTALLTGSTLEKLSLAGTAAGGGTFTNVKAGVGLEVSSTSVASDTVIGVAGAATGTADSFAITFAGSAATGATALAPTAITAGTGANGLVLNGVESISVASAGTGFVSNSVALTSDKLQTVTVTGDKALSLSFTGTNGVDVSLTPTDTVNGVKLIDGSAATGALTVTTANLNIANAGLTVKTGSGNDTITLSQKATVDAGAGNDTIISAADGGTFTGGAGNDKFDVSAAVATGTTAADAIKVTITDFTAGDSVKLLTTSALAAGATTLGAKTTLATTVTTLDLALQTATLADTANEISWFQYGGDTYLVANNNNTTLGNGDLVVKLTGLVDLTNSTLDTTSHYLTLA